MKTLSGRPALEELKIGEGYHSCLMTTFSLDFSFVEHRLVRNLQDAGVVNLCILADDRMMQQGLGELSGRSLRISRRYSVSTIVRNAAFHPKICLLFGRERALLMIGSGNLTSAGYGRNYELWAAIRTSGPKDPATGLFLAALGYVRGLFGEVRGYAQQKFDWALNNSSWLKDAEEAPPSRMVDLGGGISGTVLLGNASSCLFSGLESLVPAGRVRRITVAAPFFDQSGAMLARLSGSYPKAEVRVALHPGQAAAPADMRLPRGGRIVFHDWSAIKDVDPNRFLHAKLMHFKAGDREYCLVGSPNPTSPAFGLSPGAARNDEFALLLCRESGDWLADLGLDRLGDEVDLKSIPRNAWAEGEAQAGPCHPAFRLRIQAIDRLGDRLHLFLDGEPGKNDKLALCDTWGNVLESVVVGEAAGGEKDGGRREAMITKAGRLAAFAYFRGEPGGRERSNKQLIHDIVELARGNPSPQNQRLEKLIQDLEMDNIPLVAVLDRIDLDFLFRKPDADGSGGPGREERRGQTRDSDGSNEKFSYEDFKVNEERQRASWYRRMGQAQGMFHVLDLLQDILANELGRLKAPEPEELEDDEEGLRPVKKTGNSTLEIVLDDKRQVESLRSRIIKFYKKYISLLDRQIEETHNASLEGKGVLYRADSVGLTVYTISLFFLAYLFQRRARLAGGKAPKGDETILGTKGDYFRSDDFCAIVSAVIGKFTLLLVKGVEKGEDPAALERFERDRATAYHYSLACLGMMVPFNSSLYEEEDEPPIKNMTGHWLWSMYCNVRRYLLDGDLPEEKRLRQDIEGIIRNSGIPDRRRALEGIMEFRRKMDAAFESFERGASRTDSARVDDRVFAKSFGYCYVAKTDGEAAYFGRPGLPADDAEFDFMSENKYMMKCQELRK